ncbi:MAG: L,D-transpeptidase family protein [bacterium]
MKRYFSFFLGLVCALHPATIHANSDNHFALPETCRQLIVGITEDWNSSDVTLQKWVKRNDGWQPYGQSWRGKVGRDGLAWGVGLHSETIAKIGEPIKTEGDWRAPAGVFELGDVYGYAPSFNSSTLLRYHTVTENDLWIEDPASIYYNTHVRLSYPPSNEWEKKQQMRVNDSAHRLKLFILHNAPPNAIPGAGSSIFFHIWRNGKPSSGCTVMPAKSLIKLVEWLHPMLHPLFVLLPKPVYQELLKPWGLP